MNTFLPHPDYAISAAMLDNQRLGKQRAEVKAIYEMCRNPRFATQPVVRTWRDHLWHLMAYGIACCDEWTKRGFEDNLKPFFEFVQRGLPQGPKPEFSKLFHATMRANLIRKYPMFYSRYKWTEQPMEGYAWPA